MRNMRHLEHQALRQWIVFARQKTQKIRNSCNSIIHIIKRMRNYELHRGFRKWCEKVDAEVKQEESIVMERKLIVGKASQALMMLEEGVKRSRFALGDDDERDLDDGDLVDNQW